MADAKLGLRDGWLRSSALLVALCVVVVMAEAADVSRRSLAAEGGATSKKGPVVGELYGKDRTAASEARDAADLARAAYEKAYKPHDTSPAASEAFVGVEQLYLAAIEKYVITEIGVYCRLRLAGAYQYRGDAESAAAMKREAAKARAALAKVLQEREIRRKAPDWPQLASLGALLRKPWQEKVTREDIAKGVAALGGQADAAIDRLMEDFFHGSTYAYRFRVIWTLGAINSPKARQTLLDIALKSNRSNYLPWIRGAAQEYARVVPDKSQARRLLVSSDKSLLQTAAVALRGTRIDKKLLPRLLELMRSDDHMLRYLIASVLRDDPGDEFAAAARAIRDLERPASQPAASPVKPKPAAA